MHGCTQAHGHMPHVHAPPYPARPPDLMYQHGRRLSLDLDQAPLLGRAPDAQLLEAYGGATHWRRRLAAEAKADVEAVGSSRTSASPHTASLADAVKGWVHHLRHDPHNATLYRHLRLSMVVHGVEPRHLHGHPHLNATARAATAAQGAAHAMHVALLSALANAADDSADDDGAARDAQAAAYAALVLAMRAGLRSHEVAGWIHRYTKLLQHVATAPSDAACSAAWSVALKGPPALRRKLLSALAAVGTEHAQRLLTEALLRPDGGEGALSAGQREHTLRAACSRVGAAAVSPCDRGRERQERRERS